MLLRIVFLSTLILLALQNLYAEEGWYSGSLFLRSQTRLKGEIAVKFDYNVVLFRLGKDLIVYPAHKVESLIFYDDELERNREFISLQLGVGAATVYHLYEIVLNGPLSVLRKQRVRWYSVHIDVMEYDYYVWNKTELITFQRFKRKIFPSLLKADKGILLTYVRTHKLSIHRLTEALDIINWYNEQQLSKVQLAKKE